MAERLRVLDFGVVSALRSQTLWHAVAHGVSDGAPATLSFTRSAAPYVCVGYHSSLEQIDAEYCRRHELSVLRRMVGGGPVYVDSDQLLFQICLPVADVPAARDQAIRVLLEPAASAFRALGVPAVLEPELELCEGDRKICGHGAGQIKDAVVLCGNLIERFDHARATGILALADQSQRELTLSLMRRFVAPTPLDAAEFRSAITACYAAALELSPVPGELGATEHRSVVELDELFTTASWLAGPAQRSPGAERSRARLVKVRAGVFTLSASHEQAHISATVVGGRLLQVRLSDKELNGSRPELERAVTGVSVQFVEELLSGFGDPGRRLGAAFASIDLGRLR